MDIWKGCVSTLVAIYNNYVVITFARLKLFIQLLKINIVMAKLMEDLVPSLQINVLWIMSVKVTSVPMLIQVLFKM